MKPLIPNFRSYCYILRRAIGRRLERFDLEAARLAFIEEMPIDALLDRMYR